LADALRASREGKIDDDVLLKMNAEMED